MNFIASFHKKAFGSFAAICLFSAATCAFIAFGAAKPSEQLIVLNQSNETAPYLAASLIDRENKLNFKNNSVNTVLSSSKSGKNSFYQTGRSPADFAYLYTAIIFLPLIYYYINRISPIQDNGLISIRKIE